MLLCNAMAFQIFNLDFILAQLDIFGEKSCYLTFFLTENARDLLGFVYSLVLWLALVGIGIQRMSSTINQLCKHTRSQYILAQYQNPYKMTQIN